MKKYCFIFLLLLLNLPCFISRNIAQQGLLIQNKKKNIAWMYEVGSNVTYIKFLEQEYTRSRLNALLDSSVILGKDTILLKDIAAVRRKSLTHNVARIIGMPLMLIGAILIGDGFASIYSNPDSDTGYKLFLVGSGIFTIGYLPYHLELKDLEAGIGGEWTIQIYRGENKPLAPPH